MATLTMLQVLKRQKSYQQALFVLKMLEEKQVDPALIKKERKEIVKKVKAFVGVEEQKPKKKSES